MQRVTLAALCLATSWASLAAQSWEERVDRRWPGDSIRKATESEFAQFAATSVPLPEKAAATEAFLAAQWQAQDLPATHPDKVFLVPSFTRFLPTAIPLDAGVPEGPEPNGDPNAIGGGTPTVMGCGDQGEGAVFPYGDRDWWQVTLPAAQRIVAFTGPGLGSAIDDTVLELYDQTGNLLTANDDHPGRGRFSQVTWDAAAAGTLFVAVRGYADVRTGSYSLDVLCGGASGGGPGSVQEGPEPNNNGASSTSLPCGSTGTGTLSPLADSDWWALVLGSTTNVVIETMPTGSAVPDTTLTLRSQVGTQLLFDDDGGQGLYSRIIATLSAGTYYVDVQAYNNQYTGDYDLTVSCQGTFPEASEPNNTANTASSVTCGNLGDGNIAPLGDSDWWRIVLTGASTLTIETRAGTTGPINDTTLTLRDANGAQLAFDNDGGAGQYSRISTSLAPGVYFADVRAFNNASTGTYLLAVDCVGSGGGSGTASFVPFPGGCAGTAGTPTIGTRAGELPLLGSTFAFELDNVPALSPSVSFFGFSTTAITGSGTPLPLDLALIGAPGCRIEVDPLAFLPLSAPRNGVSVGYLPVPGDAILAGITLHVQAVVVDLPANQLGLTLSNHGTAVLGGF